MYRIFRCFFGSTRLRKTQPHHIRLEAYCRRVVRPGPVPYAYLPPSIHAPAPPPRRCRFSNVCRQHAGRRTCPRSGGGGDSRTVWGAGFFSCHPARPGCTAVRSYVRAEQHARLGGASSTTDGRKDRRRRHRVDGMKNNKAVFGDLDWKDMH